MSLHMLIQRQGYCSLRIASQFFITGKLSMRGRDGGRYPYQYEEMINHLFGTEKNRIEVCSGSIKGRTLDTGCILSSLNVKDTLSSVLNLSSSSSSPFTVDINPDLNPDYVADAQRLDNIPNGYLVDGWVIRPITLVLPERCMELNYPAL